MDIVVLWRPRLFTPRAYGYAFLVHPRNHRDIFRKFPFLRFLPAWGMRLFERYWFPTTVSRITGLTDTETGEPVRGFVISIPMTAQSMLDDRTHALAQIRRATRLARNKGAKIIGLGALTASLSAGGRALTDIDGIVITTGHAYTGHTVSNTLLRTYEDMGVDPTQVTVAIVGAAGSIGSTSARLLAQSGVPHIILIDLQRKLDTVVRLRDELQRQYPRGTFAVTDDLSSIRKATGVITATNAPDALVRSDHVADGTIIVDDAQPTDVAEELFDRQAVLVLEAGAVRTPGISAHFKMGLAHPEDNFCCMAEVLILAAHRWNTSTVGDVQIDTVTHIAALGDALGFTLAPRQNERGLITDAHFAAVATAVRARMLPA